MKPFQRSASIAMLFLPLSSPADEIDDFVEAERKKQNIPGLSIAVTRNGKVVKAQGYGLANIELSVPATKDTVYQSGSVGKQFTATAVMVLVEEGKLGLDDPIGKYLAGAPELWKDITVRHLLTHTSGIKDLTNKLDLRKDYNDDQLVEMAAKEKLNFSPGEQWSYSNTAYALLGVIVKKASGKFYGDVLKERVFEPFGMTTARVNTEADIIPNRAAGYVLKGKDIKNQSYVSPSLNTTADGSLILTVLDLANWDMGLYSEKVLKQSVLEQMWTPVKLSNGTAHPYGFGWAIGEQRGSKEIEHGGAWQGFQAHISRFVDHKLGVVILTNRVGSDPGRIARGIAGFYEPSLTPLSRLKPSKDSDPKLTEAHKELATELGAGKFDLPSLAAENQAYIAKLSAVEKDRKTRALRSVKSLQFVADDDVGDRNIERHSVRVHRLRHYQAETSTRPTYLTFYLTADGKVVEIRGRTD